MVSRLAEPQGQSTQTRTTGNSRGVGLVVETGSADSMDQEVTAEEAIIEEDRKPAAVSTEETVAHISQD